MAITVIVHIMNADPIVAEIDSLPTPETAFLICTNPRTRAGKAVPYIEREATRVLIPWHRISFVETLPSEEDMVEIEPFFRD
ncbi:MAG: hypothetical protein D6784_14720 [Chloroflexi bacterium]|nr:MAG: hypothetical protein D6784_14720 [Chloroflexota bacterium]